MNLIEKPADVWTESRGVRVTVSRDRIKVEVTEQLPGEPLVVEIEHVGVLLVRQAMDPNGHPYCAYPPPGYAIDLGECTVRVRQGAAVLCERRGGDPFVTVQCGWMPCVACRDSKLYPGRMWVGKNKLTGNDEWITCPECRGDARVPRYKHLDPATGREIDYEHPPLAGTPNPGA